MTSDMPDEEKIQREPNPPRPPLRVDERDDDDELAYRRLRRSIRKEPEEVVSVTDFIVPVNVNPGLWFPLIWA